MLASRLPLATAPGTLLALATFWLLWMTINMPLDVEYRIAPDVDYQPRIPDSEPVTPGPEPPPLPVLEIPDAPPGPRLVVDPPAPPTVGKPSHGRTMYVPPPAGPRIGGGGSNREAMVQVRIEPRYPYGAAARNREGWVLVEFSVTASGAVTDARVVDADPPGVFDKATLDAVRQWRYWPKIVDGEPVDSVGLRTVVRYELPDG